MSLFIYTHLISNLLDPRLVDPGSTLIHVGAYDQWAIKIIVKLLFYYA